MNVYDALVTTEKEEYTEALPVWDQVDDCVAGEIKVKGKGQTYLPKPNPTDLSKANEKRYEQYLFRALYMNAVGRTLSAMVGVVFSKPPKIELPDSLNYLIENADGNGLGLEQVARGGTEENVKKGRHGYLVDYPETDGVVTVQDQNDGEIHAYIISYTAQNIINWRTVKVGAVDKICLIVLREYIDVIDGYESEVNEQYRVLWLDEDGYYNVSVMGVRQNAVSNDVETYNEQTYQPTDANGNRLTEIPFKFVGSKDNDYTIDEAPLYDLSVVNLSHYRNSADNEESSYLVGQPTLILKTDLSTDELNKNNPCGVNVGSRAAIVLGSGDSVELLQAQENNLPKSNMQDKEEMMTQIGARLVSPSKQQTAEAARINYGAETSQLSTIVANENEAIQDCIRWCSLFENGTEETEFLFELNSNFFHETVTSQEMSAWIGAIQSGNMAKEDFLNRMRAGGLIAEGRTNQDILEDIETQEPTV